MLDIKKLREKTEKTQDDFAKWLHIPIKTLQKWEQGVSSPPPYVLELIEYKVFCTYMVASSISDFQSDSQQRSDCSAVIHALEDSAIEFRLLSKSCIYAPDHGGCVSCPHSDDDSDYCFKLSSWIRYKEFCPD